ncbi:MAG TPA: hypothetical protein VNQ14_09415, partial [Woeseiaceae bacterium]|nr:hypothetical protein [Woeseiaceae bacterium]
MQSIIVLSPTCGCNATRTRASIEVQAAPESAEKKAPRWSNSDVLVRFTGNHGFEKKQGAASFSELQAMSAAKKATVERAARKRKQRTYNDRVYRNCIDSSRCPVRL